MKDKKPFTKIWLKAKKLAEDKQVEQAQELLDTMIVHLAKISMKGVTELEGLKVDLWKDRAWLTLESIGLIPELDEFDKELFHV